MRKFRRGARLVNYAQCVTRLDRNERIRIVTFAELRERRSKGKGKQAGIIGQSGLRILRTLLFDFHNAGSGLCVPSYNAIQARTGYCRATVAGALKRLADAGIIAVARRLVRDGWRVLQTTNAYLFPTTPLLPPSLESRKKPPVQRFIPFAELSGSLRNALDHLAARIAAKKECS